MQMYSEKAYKREDMLRCTLCANAPCDQACTNKLEPAKQLRSIWFGNEVAAAAALPDHSFG